jgi:uncharacterized repeat protein (TIGR03803 family)
MRRACPIAAINCRSIAGDKVFFFRLRPAARFPRYTCKGWFAHLKGQPKLRKGDIPMKATNCLSHPFALNLPAAVFAALLLTALPQAQAQTEKVLYSFCNQLNENVCEDGAYPQGGVVRDSKGNLYGTTRTGSPNNLGEVFKITPTGEFSVFYSFRGTPDGAQPQAGLIIDSVGNLYGTTESGGTFSNLCAGNYGCGTVFEITPSGSESVLYTFGTDSEQDGTQPITSLTRDSDGNLFGVTSAGGTQGGGTVFKLTPKGKKTTLYNFSSDLASPDPANPFYSGSLAIDSADNLYGTTVYGGGSNGSGTVFEITAGGQESIVYSFCAKDKNEFCAGGSSPYASVIIDKDGLYGTTFGGGKVPGASGQGDGTVFKITPAGNHVVLYNFGSTSTDAAKPAAALSIDNQGNLYGTTVEGGVNGQYGNGTLYKVATRGGVKEQVVWSFGGTGDGLKPECAPLLNNGKLYGTTPEGGTNGYGTVWEVTP